MRAPLAALLLSMATPLAAQTPPRWSLVPELRVGGGAAGPEYEFTTIRNIAIGPNGSIYLTQGQEQEIRVYDAQGKYVRTIGRKGGGPGEFTGLGSIGFVGDTLYTTDFEQRRVTLFRADGSLITTIRSRNRNQGQRRYALGPVISLSTSAIPLGCCRQYQGHGGRSLQRRPRGVLS